MKLQYPEMIENGRTMRSQETVIPEDHRKQENYEILGNCNTRRSQKTGKPGSFISSGYCSVALMDVWLWVTLIFFSAALCLSLNTTEDSQHFYIPFFELFQCPELLHLSVFELSPSLHFTVIILEGVRLDINRRIIIVVLSCFATP